jgi:ABC-type proline/glycine betaine transport system substrate-binding protein
MVDYNALKVPELKKLLTDRSLPVSGNKADLIARLQENDKKPEAVAGKFLKTIVAFVAHQLQRQTLDGRANQY